MALISPQEAAQKWAQRSAAAAGDYVAGAQRTDKDPTALAIAAGPRYLQRVQESFNSGKWANGLRRAGRQGWLDGVVNKGATNYSNGVSQSEQKMAAALGPLFAYQQSLLSRIQSMPNVTDAQRDARAIAWIQGMRQYQRPS